MSKFIHFNSIYRVNIANLNSAEGGGNQITLKKIGTFSGEEFVYVSGQAFRRYLRESIYWLTDGEFNICGIDTNGSPVIKNTEGKPIIENKKITDASLKGKGYSGVMEYVIQHEPELDLFGFLLPLSEKEIGHLRKSSPFQTTALLSAFPYNYNTDMMTRSKTQQEGDIVKVELDTMNYLQGAQIINLELIGAYWDESNEKIVKVVNCDEKKRINWLLCALQNTMGGAKKARLLNDFSPKFIIASIQNTGVPYFSHSVKITPPTGKANSISDVKGIIDIEAFKDSLKEAKDFVDKVYVGMVESAFLNGEEIKQELKKLAGEVEVGESINDVFDKVKNDLKIRSEIL